MQWALFDSLQQLFRQVRGSQETGLVAQTGACQIHLPESGGKSREQAFPHLFQNIGLDHDSAAQHDPGRIKVTTFADGCSALTDKSQIGILASGVIKWKQRSYRCQ